MEYILIGFVAGGIIILIVYLLVRHKDPGYSHQKYIHPQKNQISDLKMLEGVKKLLSEGKKINAIKLVVENKKMRLIEAKSYVEEIEKNISGIINKVNPEKYVNLKVLQDRETLKRVIELVRSGNKIEAIKVVTQNTGMGLIEAKDFVESIRLG